MTRQLLGILLALACSACGDATSSTGELGRIDYSLYTYYKIDSDQLTDVNILTGYTQIINTDLTSTGVDDADTPGDIVHSVSGNASIDQSDADADTVPTIYLTASDPGSYTIESWLDGDLFDTITLSFDDPVALDAITWIRQPGDEDFSQTEAATPTVPEGTQVAYLPYPLDGAGDRLAGVFDATLSADPASSVVAAYNLDGIYEEGIWGRKEDASVYFIEPGKITLTLRDDVHGIEFVQDFQVDPVAR
ncbi:MAG: hypothetical protein GXP62_09215 [Oligoflexia bacterium]|nr:hypothetical protein [Oligoflexia bacterium]